MSESRRSAACANGKHEMCPHLMNLRLTVGALCRCAGHASCPVSGPDAADLSAWWDACTCPGAGEQRARGRRWWHQDRPPTMYEEEQQLRAQEAALARARAALVTRASGLPLGTVRQMLVDELRSQGTAVPADSVLDREAGRIQRAVPPGTGPLSAARMLARMYRHLRAAERDLRSAVQQAHTLLGPHGERPYVIFDADHSLPTVQVEGSPSIFAELCPPGGEVFVTLLPEEGSGPGRVSGWIGDRQIGFLPAGEGGLYQPAMAAARVKGAVLMVKGTIDSSPDTVARLEIYPAGIL